MCRFCLSLATQNVQPSSRPESQTDGLCFVMVCDIEHVAMFFCLLKPSRPESQTVGLCCGRQPAVDLNLCLCIRPGEQLRSLAVVVPL